MEVVQDPRLVSGFVYEQPLSLLPAVTHCGEAVTRQDHVMFGHQHAGFEFMLACRGSYTWSAAHRQYRQRAGDIFIAFPGQPHRTAAVAHPLCHQLWLGVRLDQLGAEAAALGRLLTGGGHQLIAGCAEAEPLLRGIVQQAVGGRPHSTSVARAYLATFVLLLTQRLSGAAADPIEPVGVRYSYPVLKAIRMMRQNLSERLDIADLAKASGLGVSQLCRLFREQVGHSPAQYHRQLRLDAAKERLRAPAASITEVALSCGFASAQHLSRVFRDSVGTTPGQWQRAGQPAAEQETFVDG